PPGRLLVLPPGRVLAVLPPGRLPVLPPGRLLVLPPGRVLAVFPPGRLLVLLRLFAPPGAPGRWALPPACWAGAACGALAAGLLGAAAWGAGAGALFFCADANAVIVRRTSNTDHFGRTIFPRLLKFIATPVRCK